MDNYTLEDYIGALEEGMQLYGLVEKAGKGGPEARLESAKRLTSFLDTYQVIVGDRDEKGRPIDPMQDLEKKKFYAKKIIGKTYGKELVENFLTYLNEAIKDKEKLPKLINGLYGLKKDLGLKNGKKLESIIGKYEEGINAILKGEMDEKGMEIYKEYAEKLAKSILDTKKNLGKYYSSLNEDLVNTLKEIYISEAGNKYVRGLIATEMVKERENELEKNKDFVKEELFSIAEEITRKEPTYELFGKLIKVIARVEIKEKNGNGEEE